MSKAKIIGFIFSSLIVVCVIVLLLLRGPMSKSCRLWEMAIGVASGPNGAHVMCENIFKAIHF